MNMHKNKQTNKQKIQSNQSDSHVELGGILFQGCCKNNDMLWIEEYGKIIWIHFGIQDLTGSPSDRTCLEKVRELLTES